jgi:hypothetical protein
MPERRHTGWWSRQDLSHRPRVANIARIAGELEQAAEMTLKSGHRMWRLRQQTDGQDEESRHRPHPSSVVGGLQRLFEIHGVAEKTATGLAKPLSSALPLLSNSQRVLPSPISPTVR